MTSIQKIMTQALEKVPHRLLEKQIAKKLKAAGVSNFDEVAPKLLEHALSGSKENFSWDDGEGPVQKVALTITDEELADIERDVKAFMRDTLPEIIQKTAERSAKDLLVALKKDWPQQSDWEQATISLFRENLEARWGKGLGLLRMLLTICREIGAENLKRQRRSKRKRHSHLRDVLIRLHARACQVTDEIITLLESGFADGAMARWRTLYEIGVVATVIADCGEEMAERYVMHQIIEAKSAMDEYARCSLLLGYKPVSKRESVKIVKDHDDMLAKYGKEFGSLYGWAAHHLNRKKPIFPDLESAAGRAAMRSHYKMASYNVHASAKGIFFRLSLLDSSGVIAGASNAGLTEPGQNTAITLTIITSLLFGRPWKLEDIVALQTLAKLRDEIPGALYRAEHKLKRDDARHRKQNRTGKRSAA